MKISSISSIFCLYVLAMAESLHHWFKPVDLLATSKGLSTTMSPATIQDVNAEVRNGTSSTSARGTYVKLISEQQAIIAQYASLHGNTAVYWCSWWMQRVH